MEKYQNDNIDDQRCMRRYTLRLPLVLANGVGVTHNLSGIGVLFTTAENIAAGAVIRFLLIMDAEQSGERIACNGKVVRVEQSSEMNRVAVALEDVHFAV